jgi:alkanesulfonate monooxygenase SsuD/methylene tetrahydromethanopterin reductase-like flavin-dependent oxidoreductase (luciferase family)
MKDRFAAGEPRPVQQPHPPLLIGGAQPGILALAAREADIVSIAPSLLARSIFGAPPRCTPAQALDRQLRWMHRAAPGRAAVIERQIVAFPTQVTRHARVRAGELGQRLDQPVEEVLAAPHVLLGTVASMCETLEERRERWGISYVTVPTQVAEAFAPVVERLRGQ